MIRVAAHGARVVGSVSRYDALFSLFVLVGVVVVVVVVVMVSLSPSSSLLLVSSSSSLLRWRGSFDRPTPTTCRPWISLSSGTKAMYVFEAVMRAHPCVV